MCFIGTPGWMITGTDGRRDSLKLALGAGCGLHKLAVTPSTAIGSR